LNFPYRTCVLCQLKPCRPIICTYLTGTLGFVVTHVWNDIKLSLVCYTRMKWYQIIIGLCWLYMCGTVGTRAFSIWNTETCVHYYVNWLKFERSFELISWELHRVLLHTYTEWYHWSVSTLEMWLRCTIYVGQWNLV
jgi:hypothetical protein